MSGRPREFDIDDALDAALQAFWARGYEATSMADLMAATGLQKGSLYKAFGSKHELFMRALDRYLEGGLAKLRGMIDAAATPRDGVHAWFSFLLGICGSRGTRTGCFALNSVVELGPHDAVAQARLKVHFKMIQSVIEVAIAEGQEAGEFREDESARTLAEFAFTIGNGLLASSKGAVPRAQSERVVAIALRALEA
jgi:TetR/AcrR family transcriptional regulator, transcriptional repressor for nem operon